MTSPPLIWVHFVTFARSLTLVPPFPLPPFCPLPSPLPFLPPLTCLLTPDAEDFHFLRHAQTEVTGVGRLQGVKGGGGVGGGGGGGERGQVSNLCTVIL